MRSDVQIRNERGERGAVAVIIALSLIVLIAFILLAAHTGALGMVRGMLQGSADQAAMAGASQLKGSVQGLTDAKIEASRVLENGRNFPRAVNEGSDLSIAGNALQTGIWDLEQPGMGFTPSSDETLVNAVRVVGHKTRELNGPVGMFISGGIWGPETVDVHRVGIAAVGSCSGLFCKPDLPLAVCDNKLVCGQKIRLLQSPTPSENAAWTGFLNSNADAKILRGYIRECETIPDVRQGDCISLTTGQVASAQQALEDKFESWMAGHPCPNVRLPDLEVLECDEQTCGPRTTGDPIDINGDGVVDSTDCGMMTVIPVIPCGGGGSACSDDSDLTDDSLTGQRELVRFVVMVITDVEDQGSPKYVDGYPLCGIRIPGSPTGPGPSCSPSSPTCCSTEPILVNKDLIT